MKQRIQYSVFLAQICFAILAFESTLNEAVAKGRKDAIIVTIIKPLLGSEAHERKIAALSDSTHEILKKKFGKSTQQFEPEAFTKKLHDMEFVGDFSDGEFRKKLGAELKTNFLVIIQIEVFMDRYYGFIDCYHLPEESTNRQSDKENIQPYFSRFAAREIPEFIKMYSQKIDDLKKLIKKNNGGKPAGKVTEILKKGLVILAGGGGLAFLGRKGYKKFFPPNELPDPPDPNDH